MQYTYFCPRCNKEKEEDHGMFERPGIKCVCGEIMKIKITGGSGTHFKGSGFTRKIG